jgi:hypothetical protein
MNWLKPLAHESFGALRPYRRSKNSSILCCMDPQNRISAYTRLTELRADARSHGNSLLREWWLDYKYGPLYRPLRHP